MCPPLLFGTALPGAMTMGATTAGTAGLLGSGGVFNLATGSLTSGLYSSVARMGVGTAFNLVGAGTKAYAAAYQGQMAAANMTYQAQMMEYDRKISENNALMAERAAEYDADTFDMDKKRLLASQRVGYAKSNVLINQDTPLEISADTAAEAQLERLAILYKGSTQSQAYLQKAVGEEAAAARYRLNAKTSLTSGVIGAVSEVAKGGYDQYRYGAGRSLLG